MIELDQVPLADEQDDRSFMDHWIHDFGACSLSAAAQVGLFEALAKEARTPQNLAGELSLEPGAVTVLCRALVAMDALLISGDAFELAPSGRLFWLPSSPTYRGLEFDRHREWEQHERIVETLKSGWSPLLDTTESFTEAWQRGDVSEESAQNFTRVMHSMILTPCLAAVRSGVFSGVAHLVDIGGGSGALAAALIAHQPGTRATVLDLEPVCRVSRAILAETSSGSRVEYCPANFFQDPWPSDADALSLSNILHDWPLEVCRELVGKAFVALPPGGKLFVQEALLGDDLASPRMAALFSLLMYINHHGQQFTRDGLFALLGEQGFTAIRVESTYSHWSVVVATKPHLP